MEVTKIESIFDIEEILLDNGVSIYPITRQKASLGAYGSTISWTAINHVMKEYKTRISKEKWIEYIECLNDCSYLSPTIKLLSLWLNRFIQIEYGSN